MVKKMKPVTLKQALVAIDKLQLQVAGLADKQQRDVVNIIDTTAAGMHNADKVMGQLKARVSELKDKQHHDQITHENVTEGNLDALRAVVNNQNNRMIEMVDQREGDRQTIRGLLDDVRGGNLNRRMNGLEEIVIRLSDNGRGAHPMGEVNMHSQALESHQKWLEAINPDVIELKAQMRDHSAASTRYAEKVAHELEAIRHRVSALGKDEAHPSAVPLRDQIKDLAELVARLHTGFASQEKRIAGLGENIYALRGDVTGRSQPDGKAALVINHNVQEEVHRLGKAVAELTKMHENPPPMVPNELARQLNEIHQHAEQVIERRIADHRSDLLNEIRGINARLEKCADDSQIASLEHKTEKHDADITRIVSLGDQLEKDIVVLKDTLAEHIATRHHAVPPMVPGEFARQLDDLYQRVDERISEKIKDGEYDGVLPKTVTRTIVGLTERRGYACTELIATANDGTLWRFSEGIVQPQSGMVTPPHWVRLPAIPQP